jgi:hypothetical protein
MRSKNLHFALVVFSTISFSTIAKAQLYINNAQFFIQSNATVTVQGTLTSNTSIQGAGTVIMNGSANQSLDMGGNTIPKLQINNAANVTLASSVQVDTTLTFTSGDLVLGNFNLTIGSSNTAAITGAGTTTGFVVTNGTGVVTKNSLGTTPFTFAVGDSSTNSSYLPLIIANTGTVDNYSVKASPHVYTAGTTGSTDTKEVVDASWTVSETTPGGGNLTMTAGWDTLNEMPHLNRTKVGIGYYITTAGPTLGWDLLNSQTGSATNVGPVYSCSRATGALTGTFAVGTRPVESPLLITPKVFLQGCYNVGTGVMNEGLSAAVIPTTEPYTALGFTQAGSGGGETISDPTILTRTNASTDIVDWVFVELRQTSNDAVVSTRSVLLERNGTLVETDGVTPVNMAGNAAGTYYFSIRHRNHLGVRIMNSLALAKTTTTNYDFTTSLNQAYKGAVLTNQMATLTTNIYGMWGGDVNENGATKYSGPNNDNAYLLNTILGANKNGTLTGASGYNNGDINMDGTVKYSGPNNDNAYLLNTVLISSKIATATQPTF